MNKEYKDFYWLNDLTEQFLSRGYLSEGETPKSRVKDIANHAESLLGIPGFSEKFYGYMAKGYYSLSSPVWSNFGKKRGMPVSCFGSHVQDSVPGILKASSEIGAMSKIGGGTACYMGEIRPRGANITDNGTSTGSVHFLELFQSITDVISQGSTRRGRTAAYQDIDHKDIMEFLDIATEGNPIQNMTTAVVVPEGWMESMIDGDSEKRKVWAKVLKRRSELGYPYIMFKDNVNNHTKPEVYANDNVNHSQLCVSGDSMVQIEIDGNEMEVPIVALNTYFHSNEYTTLQVKSYDLDTNQVVYRDVVDSAKMSDSAEVLEIFDEASGKTITCTPDHKIYTKNRGYVFAKDLQETDELLVD